MSPKATLRNNTRFSRAALESIRLWGLGSSRPIIDRGSALSARISLVLSLTILSVRCILVLRCATAQATSLISVETLMTTK